MKTINNLFSAAIITSFVLMTTALSAQKTISQVIESDTNSNVIFQTTDEVEVLEWNNEYIKVETIITAEKVRPHILEEIAQSNVFELNAQQNENGLLLNAPAQRKSVKVNNVQIEWTVTYKVYVPTATNVVQSSNNVHTELIASN